MTTDNFCFYLANKLIQTSQTGGQQYSDTSPFSIPWLSTADLLELTSLDQLILKPKNLTEQATLMRRSTVLSLPLQSVFPGASLV